MESITTYPIAYRLPPTTYHLPRFGGVHARIVRVLGLVDPHLSGYVEKGG